VDIILLSDFLGGALGVSNQILVLAVRCFVCSVCQGSFESNNSLDVSSRSREVGHSFVALSC